MPEEVSTVVERVVAAAADEQRSLGHPRIGTEHLLLGLLAGAGDEAADLLIAAGASLLAARHMVAEVVVTDVDAAPASARELTPRAHRALDRAGRFARRDRASDVTDRHVLLGVLDVEGLACQVLRRLGVDLSGLRRSASGEDVDERPDEVADIADEAANEPVDDVPAEPVRPGTGPACGGCGAPLDGGLAVTRVDAIDDVDGRPVPVRVVHCGSCGVAVGLLA